MSRPQWTALAVIFCLTLSFGIAEGQAGPVFYKGTDTGCEFRAAHGSSWQAVDVPKLMCGAQTSLKTESGSWGTIVYPFGSMTLHPQSEVLFQHNGLVLRQGKYRAFIHATPRGFRFRIPQATIGIRGTIFTATGEGGVAVSSGEVEVAPDDGAPVQVGAGGAWKMPNGDSGKGIPQVLSIIEAALKAEHDHQFAAAAGYLLDALQNPALDGLSEYRDHLASKVLQDLARAGKDLTHALAARAGSVLKQSPEAWYGVMEELLSKGAVDSVKALLAFAAPLRPEHQEDPRDQIIRGLTADFEGNTAAVTKFVSDFSAANDNADQWTRFWGHSRTYLQIQAGATNVPSAHVTQMVSPAGMLGLSLGVARQRAAAAYSLPYGVLEAQGLYYLIRGYAAAGDHESVAKVMEYFGKVFPGSPWLGKAREMADRMGKAAPVGKIEEPVVKKTPVSAIRKAGPEPKHKTGESPSFESVKPGKGATGTTSSPNTPPSEVPSSAADSIYQAY